MKADIYIIEIVKDKNKGLYRVIGNSEDQAIDRAQISFKNEFGEIGKVQTIKKIN